MTADVVLIIRTLFTSVFSLFTSWYIPGTNVTPASFFIFLIVAFLVLRVISRVFGGGDKDE